MRRLKAFLKRVVAFMRKWANELGLGCLAVFVGCFGILVANFDGEAYSRHSPQARLALEAITVLLLVGAIVGIVLGFLDARQADRERDKERERLLAEHKAHMEALEIQTDLAFRQLHNLTGRPW